MILFSLFSYICSSEEITGPVAVLHHYIKVFPHLISWYFTHLEKPCVYLGFEVIRNMFTEFSGSSNEGGEECQKTRLLVHHQDVSRLSGVYTGTWCSVYILNVPRLTRRHDLTAYFSPSHALTCCTLESRSCSPMSCCWLRWKSVHSWRLWCWSATSLKTTTSRRPSWKSSWLL